MTRNNTTPLVAFLVNEDGTHTIRFLVDDQGAVTGVEERWARRRGILPRKT